MVISGEIGFRRTLMEERPLNFLEKIIEDDLKNNRVPGGKIVTRFPPEPNGYLHIGHIKSIVINFGLAEKYGGKCHLRLDDTNPAKEETEYIDSIKEDIKWLGYSWGNDEYYASDYYDKLYEIAINLIREGKAYVDSLSAEEMKEYRGTLTEGGKESPDRNRPIEENLRLFEEMREGKYPEGKYTLRAKIDMQSPNINLRDPALYRIKYAEHPRTGKKWCIYPMYDFTHPISDAIEGITHSICTLEFEDHRPAYDWATSIDGIEFTPHQYEFARLNISYLLMSKRKLLYLVNNNFVTGWDDPRMPTISGVRRRGYSPESMKDFVTRVGVAKVESMVDYALMEFCVREDLNKRAKRLMAVLDPVELVIEAINGMAAERIAQGYKVGIIGTEESRDRYRQGIVKSIGTREDEATIASHLYAILREFDHEEVDYIYSESFARGGIGNAIMNRLLKAAGHHVINI